jgi:hypothetical protein
MLDYLRDNGSQILDGLLFGLGILAVYLGAVFTAALIRSLGGAGSHGITIVGRYLRGWFYYLRGDDRDLVNVTLNTIVGNRLTFDTLVADRRIWFVWPNAYQQGLIRRAARRTTRDNPLIQFSKSAPEPRSLAARLRHRCNEAVHNMLGSVKVVQDGKSQRVRVEREDDYKATYGPLISLVSEKCNNADAIDLAIGHPMDEYRFVIALTYEQLGSRRARHLRALVMWEETLKNLPAACPQVDIEDHRTRYRTLQCIARRYAEAPECFGIVKVWRPRRAQSPSPHSVDDLARLAPVQPVT